MESLSWPALQNQEGSAYAMAIMAPLCVWHEPGMLHLHGLAEWPDTVQGQPMAQN